MFPTAMVAVCLIDVVLKKLRSRRQPAEAPAPPPPAASTSSPASGTEAVTIKSRLKWGLVIASVITATLATFRPFLFGSTVKAVVGWDILEEQLLRGTHQWPFLIVTSTLAV